MKVVKRDCTEVEFEKSKITNAILKAFSDVDYEEVTEEAKLIAERIAIYVEELNKTMTVEDIQNIVEEKLMDSDRKDVAKEYIRYRYDREKARERNSRLMKDISEKIFAKNVQNQNANVDERSFGGRTGEATSIMMKDYALNYCMSEMSKNNHLNNEIYIHDLDSYAIGSHNCLTIPFDDLLANGFNTRQVDIRPANSINTAMQLVAVIFQLQSLMQFGGVSASHLDWTMIPYVRKSFYKHWKDGLKHIGNIKDENHFEELDKKYKGNEPTIDSIEYKVNMAIYNYAMDMTERELKQSVEALFHNLNSLQSRSGNQLPFSSINYGTCTLPEGRMVIKALINGSINGVGKFHSTSIFPCCIFQCMSGVNRKPGEPNYDLYRLALKSTAQRLYPNYANCDWSGNDGYDKNDPRTIFSTMGKCKSAHVKHPQTNCLLGVA